MSFIKRIPNKDWNQFPLETEFPQTLKDHFTKSNVFRSGHGIIYSDCIWYKGEDYNTATEWCFIMDDGCYYKVGAGDAFWHTNPSGELVLQCTWSYNHLNKTVRNYLKTGQTLRDPGYTT